MMEEVKRATTFEDQAAALSRLRQRFEEVSGGFDKGSDAAKAMLAQIIEAEDASKKLAHAQDATSDATTAASKAANTLSLELGTASDAAAELLARLSNVPLALSMLGKGVAQQITSLGAANKSLELQIGGMASAAADRTVQLQTMVDAAAKGGGNIRFDDIANAQRQINELNKLGKEQERLQKTLSDQTKSSRGGGRGKQTDLQKYNKDLAEELKTLQAQEYAYNALATSTLKSEAATKLYGEAAVVMGGHVDEATMAILRQIDAQVTKNRDAAAAAASPARAFMESVPTYQEGVNKIQTTALDSLQSSFVELFKTGEFGLASFADSMINVLAEVLASQTVKAFLGLFDNVGKGGSGGGGWFGQLVGAVFGLSEGGYSDRASPHRHMVNMAAFASPGLPHYAEGTPNTSGGIPAMLHPNEAVIPLSRGRKIPVEMRGGEGAANANAVPVNIGDIVTHVNVDSHGGDLSDPKVAAKLAESLSATIRLQIRESIANETRYGGIFSPRAA